MTDKTAFVSILPGRIRLRHPLLRDTGRHRALTARLLPLALVEGNPVIGSLLLRFDPADTSMETRIRAEVAAVLPDPSAPASPRASPHMGKRIALPQPHKAKWQINRAAKIGAVASMAVSLAALGTSRKLHAQAGALFVMMMLTHMATHWRRTFK
ncbi:hypothetical protein [Magnetospirillum gryphiswaldense]|uniref:Uncharacterized protein n=1 Tax=Magnetospirillum gryphiswaldense TaxID=55518 RepID=A4U282_9PROT|nr:hypothetical protein [Magnetospirillum gryphiswaldense]AVM74915.1 hypothetical protein MSR1_24340 [Magnetospirillum gryphiswaldense MSR-1]AVM78818.1 hypothetical protein MSR1L_24340 [Magnetospirillum gryphiswaldense]CAM76989.1 conserved hypothetical protein [Magnetospirillum gryphiswaldense MSR-1]